jgi:aspartyl aminopeptidase
VRIHRSLLRIPTLAIHLDRSTGEGFKFNNETHLTPILATAAKLALNGDAKPDDDELSEAEKKHHPLLIHILADNLHVEPSQIKDFELCLYDTQPSQFSGAFNEFIHSPRLDNLEMSFCSLTALINSTSDPLTSNLASDPTIRLVVLFDNEEVGSLTAHGANSNLLPATLARLTATKLGDKGEAKVSKTAFEEALPKSYLVSADMAHAIHPNYPEKYEENHRPKMHGGVVLKINANQRYATTAQTSLLIREIAKIENIPIQEFVVRNDSPCGSTIGPMLSAKLGLRTVDVGNPQLSMHSIREVGGTEDLPNAIKLFEAFFRHYAAMDKRIMVD